MPNGRSPETEPGREDTSHPMTREEAEKAVEDLERRGELKKAEDKAVIGSELGELCFSEAFHETFKEVPEREERIRAIRNVKKFWFDLYRGIPLVEVLTTEYGAFRYSRNYSEVIHVVRNSSVARARSYIREGLGGEKWSVTGRSHEEIIEEAERDPFGYGINLRFKMNTEGTGIEHSAEWLGYSVEEMTRLFDQARELALQRAQEIKQEIEGKES